MEKADIFDERIKNILIQKDRKRNNSYQLQINNMHTVNAEKPFCTYTKRKFLVLESRGFLPEKGYRKESTERNYLLFTDQKKC